MAKYITLTHLSTTLQSLKQYLTKHIPTRTSDLSNDSGYVTSGHKHSKSDITDFPTSMPASDVQAWAKEASKPSYTAAEVGAIATSARGASGGVAELDDTGKVPSSRLPSTVSTDLLSQGTNTLIINCGNAAF